MAKEAISKTINEVIEAMDFKGTLLRQGTYGSGHINDTIAVVCEKEDGNEIRYILQRMNTEIFTKPVELMENIWNVTAFLKKVIIANGGDPERETLNIVPTKTGEPYYKDSLGQYWRSYTFIEHATSYDKVEKPDDFYQSAVAFGNFQKLLSDYPAETLHETIVDFHNTEVRFQTLKKAIQEDICGRAASVKEEIAFALAREEDASVCVRMQKSGELPTRVTHNDTKLNNIMIDDVTGKALCIIDLDTVMPGLAINDFGDSIRFGASTGAEDEPDLTKVRMSLDLYEVYVRGYIEGCDGKLTDKELEMLPMGAKMMTYECGIRFLTDYLQGDTYFKIHREGQNLDRCRTQFQLVADMESKWTEMADIIKKYKN